MILKILLFEGYSLDPIKMTEWIWSQLVNLTENIINITTTTNMNPVNLTENWRYFLILVKFTWFMFVVVVIFILFLIFGQIHQVHHVHRSNDINFFLIFGQIKLYFGHFHTFMFVVVKFRSSSNVNVCRCQIQTVYRSSWFGQVN